MGDIYDHSYNNPFHFNRHSLGDQYKLNIQHNINNQNWLTGSTNYYPNGSILRDSAKFVLPPQRADFNQYQNNNYSSNYYPNERNLHYNTRSLDNTISRNSNTRYDKINELKYNLSPINKTEISKNLESEYRAKYIPYDPEFYKPIYQKRSAGRRLDIGSAGYLNDDNKKRKRRYHYDQLRLPDELRRKLEMLENDVGIDSEVEFPDVSETNFEEKEPVFTPYRSRKNKKITEKKPENEIPTDEKKEDEKDDKEDKKEEFIKPFIDDIQVDNNNEYEKDVEDQKAISLEKPSEVEKPEIKKQLSEIFKPKDKIKPNQKDKVSLNDDGNDNGIKNKDDDKNKILKSIINPLKQDDTKGKVIEQPRKPKPERKVEKNIEEEKKQPGPIVINKQINEIKPNDIHIDNEKNDNEPHLMEKPIEIIPSQITISKPSESDKPIINDNSLNSMKKPIPQDEEKQHIIEPKKEEKPEIKIEKKPEVIPIIEQQKPTGPKIINKQISDSKENDIPIQQIDSELKTFEKPQEIKLYKTIIKPNESEKPKENSSNVISNKPIKNDPEKQNIIEPVKVEKPIEKEIKQDLIERAEEPKVPLRNVKNVNQPPIKVEQKKKEFIPIKVEYTDIDDYEKDHQIITTKDNTVIKTTPVKPEEVSYEEKKEEEPIPIDNQPIVIVNPEPVKEPEPKKEEPIIDDNKKKKKVFIPISGEYLDKESDVGNHNVVSNKENVVKIEKVKKGGEDDNNIDKSLSGIIPGIKHEDNQNIITPFQPQFVESQEPPENIKKEEPKKDEFKPQSVNYEENITKPVDNKNTKQKKETFKPTSVEYHEEESKKPDKNKDKKEKLDKKEKKEKSTFKPIYAEYTDKDNDYIPHDMVISEDNVVDRFIDQISFLDEEEIDKNKDFDKDDNEEFHLSGIIEGVKNAPQEVGFTDGLVQGQINDYGGVVDNRPPEFEQQNVEYTEDISKGVKTDQGGVTKKKKEKFEEQAVGYVDPTFKGDNNKGPGAAKKKKEKFEQQTVGYVDPTFKGDDDKGPGAAKKKEFEEQNVEYEEKEYNKLEPNQPDYIISGIIPGLGKKELDDFPQDDDNDYPIDYYLDEDENTDKHTFKTILHKNKDDESFMDGIIYGKKENENEYGMGGLINGKKNEFKPEEVDYMDKEIRQKQPEKEKEEEKGEFIDGTVKGKKNKFKPEEVDYMDKETKQKQPEKKKEEEKGESIDGTIKGKKNKFKPEEVDYMDKEIKEKEPEKIFDNQPDYVISGLIPGIGKDVEEDDNDNYPVDYFLDEDDNDDKHNINTIHYRYKDEKIGWDGIIYGIKDETSFEHNYAGKSKEEGKASLSQIFVDYSKNYEKHNYYDDI